MEKYYVEKGYIPETLRKYGYKMHDFSEPPHSYICSKTSLQAANRKGCITKKMWDRVVKYIQNNAKEFVEYEWHSEFKNRGIR